MTAPNDGLMLPSLRGRDRLVMDEPCAYVQISASPYLAFFGGRFAEDQLWLWAILALYVLLADCDVVGPRVEHPLEVASCGALGCDDGKGLVVTVALEPAREHDIDQSREAVAVVVGNEQPVECRRLGIGLTEPQGGRAASVELD